MAVVVVGGSGRGAGKTAVGCALISAMPEFCWLAVKVTPHLHDGDSVREEPDGSSQKDTARYLRSGARRALLVQAAGEDISDKVREARAQAAGCDGLLVESGSIAAGFLAAADEPWMKLLVLAGPAQGWKESVATSMTATDAFVLAIGASVEELPAGLRNKPRFRLPEGHWMTPEIVAFVRERLCASR